MNVANENLMKIYVQNCLILVLKMLFMSIYTAFERMRNKAFDNLEDAIPMQVDMKVEDNVERIRRAHLNDLLNIPLFFFVGYIFILTNPSENLTRQLFKLYTISRIVYTMVYAVFVLPQPARILSYTIGLGITLFLTASSVQYFFDDFI